MDIFDEKKPHRAKNEICRLQFILNENKNTTVIFKFSNNIVLLLILFLLILLLVKINNLDETLVLDTVVVLLRKF